MLNAKFAMDCVKTRMTLVNSRLASVEKRLVCMANGTVSILKTNKMRNVKLQHKWGHNKKTRLRDFSH
jgi:hypothetical protein